MASRRVDVDGQLGHLAGLHRAFGDTRHVAPETGQGVGRVEHLGPAGGRGDHAGVAHLAAGLGVEGCAVGEHLDEVVVDREHRQQAALGRVVVVAGELGEAELLDDLPVGVELVTRARPGLAGVLGPAPLLGHLGLEAGPVDVDAALGGDLGGELEREAVGVVQLEGRGPREGLAPVERGQLVVEDAQAVAQRLAEALLLPRDDALDEVAVGGQLGVGRRHHVDGLGHQLGEHELLGAEQVGVAHRPADDATQHVAAVLVRGEHAVVDEHGRRPGVLGQDPQAHARCARRGPEALPVTELAVSMRPRSRSVSQTE